MRAGAWACERYALARRSSTMVLSSRIASSTSVCARRRLEGVVFARLRDGEGRREIKWPGDKDPEVRGRWILYFPSMDPGMDLGFSSGRGRVGVAMEATVVPDRCRSCVVGMFRLWMLLLRGSGVAVLLWREGEIESPKHNERVRESLPRTRASAGIPNSVGLLLQHSSPRKFGKGERRPQPSGK